MNDMIKMGLGTAAIGRPLYINIKEKKASDFDAEAFRQNGINMLDVAYDQGIRYFDTAPSYGIAEQILIDWALKKNDKSIEIASKWGYTYVANFDPNATQHEVKEHSLGILKKQWTTTEKLLPLLTTYQIHSATFESGVLENEEILNYLAKLKVEYNLHIGITTTGANQVEVLKRAMDIEIEGKELINAFQVTYNVFDQSLASVAADIWKLDKRLIIKEALANGRVFPNKKYPNKFKSYDLLSQLAEKYDVGIDAIALRFCMDSIPVYKVLSGAAVEQHISSNWKANDFKLEENDIIALKELSVSTEDYWNERKKLAWN